MSIMGFVRRVLPKRVEPKNIPPVHITDVAKVKPMDKATPHLKVVKQSKHYETAVRCLVCGAEFHHRGRYQIRWTCSTICRKIMRGGKENSKWLTKMYHTQIDQWTHKQIALYQTKQRSIFRLELPSQR